MNSFVFFLANFRSSKIQFEGQRIPRRFNPIVGFATDPTGFYRNYSKSQKIRATDLVTDMQCWEFHGSYCRKLTEPDISI